jgi:long-chain acyl-CoA synthetase
MYEQFHSTTIGALLAEQARRYPDNTYLQIGEQRWTYAQVDQQSSCLAAGLTSLGIASGDRVALILPNLPDFVISMYAAA